MSRRKAIRMFFWVGGGLVVLGGAMGLGLWSRFHNYIYPGISVAYVDVGDLTPTEAEQRLNQALGQDSFFTLTSQDRQWLIPFMDINLHYDTHQSIHQAYQVSWRRWLSTNQDLNLDPVVTWDENRLQTIIASISAQINIPAQDPEIKVVYRQISVTNGQNGQNVDEAQVLALVRQATKAQRLLPIELPITKVEPKLTETQIAALRTRASQLMDKKLKLTLNEIFEQWEIDAENILAWLGPDGWRQDKIARWVEDLAQTTDRPAENANFRFVAPGKVEEFRPAKVGVQIRQAELVTAIMAKLTDLETTPTNALALAIPITPTEPSIKTAEVNDLGIKELVGRGESNYSGSIPNRVFNVHKAASIINGILVAPDEVFSFNKHIGDISAATGYKQAYVIKNGRTVLGDGGGVCQVSSTLFRAALAAGLPIEERWAHAYRVHYYENDSQPGFDATVFSPSVDLKFKNDTGHYILIQSEVTPVKNRLVFNIYGTSDGRQVEISQARVWDVAPPPPALYQDDPTLPVGRIVQVDWAAWGAKAAFDWKVTRGDQVLQQRTFYSAFRPWQAVFLRGVRQ